MRTRKQSAGIYEIVCSANGHRYVGSTASLVRRKCDHFKHLRRGIHKCRHLQSAFLKYGAGCFSFSVLMSCGVSDLIRNEQASIDGVIASRGRGALYNANTTAGRTVHSEESRELIRASKVGEKNPFFGKKHNAESRASMSKSRTGVSTWSKGRVLSDAHRAKIAEGGVGRVQSDATKAKRSATIKRLAATGVLFGPEHLMNINIAQKKRRAREASERRNLDVVTDP